MQVRHYCAWLLAAAAIAGLPALAEAGDQARQRQQDSQQRRMRFQVMDQDGDGVITRAEWRGNLQSFRQHDRNNDGVLSGDEVWVQGTAPDDSRELSAAFARADRNNDRVLSRDEWFGDRQTFERVDRNGDGRISLAEFLGDDVAGTSGRREAFNTLDRNRNGVLTINEWTEGTAAFRALDADNDGAITRAEYNDGWNADEQTANRSAAYRAGYERGLAEGRQAGYEDKNVNGGRWDLEGQRELEQADSGYTTQVGSRADYQAGYRAGFRRGYPLGFGDR